MKIGTIQMALSLLAGGRCYYNLAKGDNRYQASPESPIVRAVAACATPHWPAGTRAVARAAGDCRLFRGAGRDAGVGPHVQRAGGSAVLGPLRLAESLLVAAGCSRDIRACL